MANQEPIKWVTINGRHIPIYEDGSIGMPKPKIAGTYKPTPEMENLALQQGIKMQKEFPELLAEEFEIRFEKYMGSTGGYGFQDYIEINGASNKRLLKESYDREEHISQYKALVAHEIIHTMQARLNTALGLRGEERDKNMKRMWDNIVDKFVSDNPDKDAAQINKLVANDYGRGGHSRLGADPEECMSTSVERYYEGRNNSVARLGEYVLQEFRSEIDKNDIRYKKR